MFEKLPPNIIQSEWEKEHIKNPPPINVPEEARKKAQEKIAMNKLKNTS